MVNIIRTENSTARIDRALLAAMKRWEGEKP
jgi:hypothetical protein